MAVLDAQRFTSDSLTSDALSTGHEGDVMSKLRAMINRSQRLLKPYGLQVGGLDIRSPSRRPLLVRLVAYRLGVD